MANLDATTDSKAQDAKLPVQSKRRRDDMAHSKPTTTDVSIMGTNDSSIVSKRSVEILYHAEPHFFQHFVKKPKRRAPLINRGYWLRMRAIEHEVQKFLHIQDGRRKVVINLGCGYDPLPFQMLSRHQAETQDVVFVDVDYPDLISNKIAMIKAAPELMAILPGLAAPDIPTGLPLRSDRYVALGCDLSKPRLLQSLLEKFLTLSESSICFVAEVSVTYMKEKGADALIKWASSMPHARFVQLEQCLPYGEHHPFASTMLKHFGKLGTRLRSLPKYPTEEHHINRFLNRGWTHASSRSLWKLWALPDFLGSEERASLDEVEPFDEWEEFALFASHYFILTATNGPGAQGSADERASAEVMSTKLESPDQDSQPSFQTCDASEIPPRSFACSFVLSPGIVGVHGGHGSRTRLSSVQILRDWSKTARPDRGDIPSSVPGRVCHTITEVRTSASGYGVSKEHHSSHILIAGRSSPDKSFADTWLIQASKADDDPLQWIQLESLPHGLYRHSAIALTQQKTGATAGILVSWGKTGRSQISESWYFWPVADELVGAHGAAWVELTIKPLEGTECCPRFGASLIHPHDLRHLTQPDSAFSGYLIGGIGANGIILEECLEWTMSLKQRTIAIRSSDKLDDTGAYRFGASVVHVPSLVDNASGRTETALISGGIAASSAAANEIHEVSVARGADGNAVISTTQYKYPDTAALLVGHTATFVGNDRILLAGGAATCFSFGTFHNKNVFMLERRNTSGTWRSVSHSWHGASPNIDSQYELGSYIHGAPKAMKANRMDANDLQNQAFSSIVEARTPLVIQNLDLGECTRRWGLSYLENTIGADRQVIVHMSDNDALDFQSKNFTYEKVPFGQFLKNIASGGKHYLRALSAESANKPADFWQDYPELAADFTLPEHLGVYINSKLANDQPRRHSSVFRVSGPVSMWLHYDVMSNILCQIHGTKRLLLYPPGDVRHLQIPSGQSSSSLNMFDSATYQRNDLQDLRPVLVDLKPGDVLFIPALWLHTALPTSGTSIAVNIFFRDLDTGYAAGRDVYGNRDLQAYEDGRRDAKRIEGRFAKLPPEGRKFYLLRLAQEMQDLAEKAGS